MLASDLKTGVIFQENGIPFVVVKYEHTKTARGRATVAVKARNLLTGQMAAEKRYMSTDRVEDADVTRRTLQYLYNDGNYVFMDPNTYEQITFNADIVGDQANYLLEGENVVAMFFEGNPVSIELPNSMVFEIVETVPGFKGNTVSNVLKEAKISTGFVVKVPTFIKVGDKVKIDTRSGEYISKA